MRCDQRNPFHDGRSHARWARFALRAVFIYEPLARAAWAWLRYLDNRCKNKPLGDPWQRRWMKFVYDNQGYGISELHGDPDGNFELTWTGPMDWERE